MRSSPGSRSGSARTSRRCGCTSTGARTRARSTGSATSASRGRPPATRRGSAARRSTSTSAAPSGRAPRSRGPVFRRVPTQELDELVHGLVGGWLDGPGGRREHASVSGQDDGRRARPCWPGASRRGAGERRRQREHHRADGRPRGRGAVGRVRGARAVGRARVGARSGSATASPLDRVPGRRRRPDRHGVPHRPGGAGLLDRHRPAAAGDARPRSRSCASDTPGSGSSCSRPTGGQRAASRRPPRAEPVPPLGGAAASLLQRPQGPAAQPGARGARLLGHRACAATSGPRAPTSARSRSTTTTTRS